MCTCIHLNSSHSYFGRNMDLDYDLDFKVILLSSSYPLTFKKEKPILNHYKIISIGVLVDNYPLICDGMNEKGLAIAGLNYPNNATYFKVNRKKRNYTPYEMVLLVLATCKNVSEVKKLFKDINIINIGFNKDTKLTPLHYMVSDKKESIVIEPDKDGIKVYDNPYNVLTNNPPFPLQENRLIDFLHLNNEPFKNDLLNDMTISPYSLGLGAISLPGDYSSVSRFVKSIFVKKYIIDDKKDNGLDLLRCLSQVSMLNGVVKTSIGYEYTRYSSCYDADKLKLYFTTYDNPNIQEVSLKDKKLLTSKLVSYPLPSAFTTTKLN